MEDLRSVLNSLKMAKINSGFIVLVLVVLNLNNLYQKMDSVSHLVPVNQNFKNGNCSLQCA